MSDFFRLTDEQMERISPYFPLSHGVPRVDDRRIISGIIFVIRNGLRWRDAPREYGPHKTIYNRFIRRGEMGVNSPEFSRHPLSLISFAVQSRRGTASRF